jgi:hypothetical protein
VQLKGKGEQSKVFRSPVHLILISALRFSAGLLLKKKKKKKCASKKSSSISNPIYIELKKENCTPFSVTDFPNTSVEELYLLGYNAV